MKQFQTESKKMLDLMINSIYTKKEVFLRELISNASDACDKLYYLSLKNNLGLTKGNFFIEITLDKLNRTITVSDNGIGMNEAELEKFLGTIAKSNSEEFKELLDKKDLKKHPVIGQFGVGFYASFMVASKIVVESKKFDEANSFTFTTSGIEGYEIAQANKLTTGTSITLTLKEDTKDNKYSEYLDEYHIKSLITKYSDYIAYPIKMLITKSHKEEGSDEYKEKQSLETINSMTPLWKKKKSEVTDDLVSEYYKNTFYDYQPPLTYLNVKVEGKVNYNALLIVPEKAPYNYFYKNYEYGLKLYTNNVLIIDNCPDLLSDYFSFVKGAVETDLDLNVSRETVQKSAQIAVIKKNIETKIKTELKRILTEDREKYQKFFTSFGLKLKFSCYENYGLNKEILQDLLIYKNINDDKYLTFSEYIEPIKENEEKFIYYVVAKNLDAAKANPQVINAINNKQNVLLCTDEVDEFLFQSLREIDGFTFKNVIAASFGNDLTLNDEDNAFIELANDLLKDDNTTVKLMNGLGDFPVYLANDSEISIDMEKTLNAQMGLPKEVSEKKVLEINYEHPIYQKLQSLKNNKEELKKYLHILNAQGRLLVGLPVKNNNEIIKELLHLLAK